MEERQSINVDRALGFLRRRGLLIASCMLLAGVAAFAISKSQQEEYTATAAVAFDEDQLTQEIAGLPVTATNVLLQNASNLELLDLGNMAAKTAAKVGHGLTERDVEEAVSIDGSTESNIAGVSAVEASPVRAAEIANVYAKQFVAAQSRAKADYFQSALKLVRKQIQAIPAEQREGPVALDLLARAHSLALLSRLQPSSVEIVQSASAPAGPSSPTTKKNTVIGLILGLFLGFGVAFLLERIDPKVRAPRELADIYGTEVLGTVPHSAELAAYRIAGGTEALGAGAESFQMIRAQLTSFNRGHPPKSLLVASAAAREGKSTVAFHLASAAAQVGLRVLLLEANFRRPSLAYRLGIAKAPSLIEAATGNRVDPVARIALASDSGPGSLSVLPAGDLGNRSPAAMIGSQAVSSFLEGVRASYDFVVVDGPDLTGVSDAFALLGKVDGLVVVGLGAGSRRDVAEDLAQRLNAANATIYGIVVNRHGRSRLPRGSKRAGIAPSEGLAAVGRVVPADAELAPDAHAEV
jgi:Mrp family chromosome partitioning ATPase/capsular polysaccharide biosynthesis protein